MRHLLPILLSIFTMVSWAAEDDPSGKGNPETLRKSLEARRILEAMYSPQANQLREEKNTFKITYRPEYRETWSLEDYKTELAVLFFRQPWVREQADPLMQFEGDLLLDLWNLPAEVAGGLAGELFAETLALPNGHRIDLNHARNLSINWPDMQPGSAKTKVARVSRQVLNEERAAVARAKRMQEPYRENEDLPRNFFLGPGSMPRKSDLARPANDLLDFANSNDYFRRDHTGGTRVGGRMDAGWSSWMDKRYMFGGHLLDEMASYNPERMKEFLRRMGDGSPIIDSTQIDEEKLKKLLRCEGDLDGSADSSNQNKENDNEF